MPITHTDRKKKTGLPPGSLIFVGSKKTTPATVTLFDYDEKTFSEQEIRDVAECIPFIKKNSVTWINVDGVHDAALIEKIGAAFDIHPLELEDIMNSEQRPKVEEYESCFFMVVKMLSYDTAKRSIRIEQVSMVIMETCVITFQQCAGDVFGPIRERIRTAKGRIRKKKSDYLAYCLLDAIIDNYFIILEKIGERIEAVEDRVMLRPSEQERNEIHRVKRETLFMRKSVWPLREALNGLMRLDNGLVMPDNIPYFRDIYDHTIQVIDTVETIRDISAGLLDLYLSGVSNRMNEIMKVLTMIATIFIPITFIAGVYGMNFRYMPELGSRWGYPLIWVTFITVAGIMIAYFKRKKWF